MHNADRRADSLMHILGSLNQPGALPLSRSPLRG